MSDTPPDTGTTETPAPADGAEPPPEVDKTPEHLAAEVDHWKKMARRHEARAKDNLSQLEQLQAATMTDHERALAEAREQARAEALAEVATDRTIDAIRHAAAGRVADVDGLLEAVDPSKFIGDDGAPDRAAIDAWVQRIAPPAQPAGPVDLGQGARPGADLALNGDPLLADLKSKLGIG